MASTAHEKARNHTPRPSEDRERSEQSPIPTTVRCRPDAGGVTVWVPTEPTDDAPGQDTEA